MHAAKVDQSDLTGGISLHAGVGLALGGAAATLGHDAVHLLIFAATALATGLLSWFGSQIGRAVWPRLRSIPPPPMPRSDDALTPRETPSSKRWPKAPKSGRL